MNSFVNCHTLNVDCIAVNHVHFVASLHRPQTIGRCNKVCQRCFLCRSVVICPTCQVDPTSIGKLGPPWGPIPILNRSPIIISGYVDPLRNSYLMEALMQKNALRKVKKSDISAFFNRLFLVPKSNNKWRPILEPSSVNKFLKLKTETLESTRTCLQTGKWVAHRFPRHLLPCKPTVQ